MADRTELQKNMETQLREIRNKIEDFEKKAEEAQGETRKQIEKALEDLRGHANNAEEQLEELRKAGDSVFETMRKDFETNVTAFTSAFENVFFSSGSSTTSGEGSAAQSDEEK